jgi:hypothetical protein
MGRAAYRPWACPARHRGAATLRTVLRRVDRQEGETKLGAWAERLCSGTLAPRDTAAGIAIDGNPSQC